MTDYYDDDDSDFILIGSLRDRVRALEADNAALRREVALAREVSMNGTSGRTEGKTILDLHAVWLSQANERAEKAEADNAALREQVAHQRQRANDGDDQLVWLATWCFRITGVENNHVIGRDGWPHKLVEVVARAIEKKLEADNAALRSLCIAASYALRSYQYGNSAPELAESTADAIDAAIAKDKQACSTP